MMMSNVSRSQKRHVGIAVQCTIQNFATTQNIYAHNVKAWDTRKAIAKINEHQRSSILKRRRKIIRIRNKINRIFYASRRKFVTVNIQIPSSATTNFDVKMQIDTASDVSIIGKKLWCKMGKPGTQTSNRYITSASKDQIKLIAEFSCLVRLQGDVKLCNLLVVDIDSLSIFGSDWLEIFGLWDKPLNSVCSQIKENKIDTTVLNSIKIEYADIFQDTPSKCTKTQVQLHLKPNAKPTFRAKRPIAYAMLSLVEDELQRLQTLGIITPVDYSDWAAPIVAVKKPNGKVRIYGDLFKRS